jgi:hypothetical protein
MDANRLAKLAGITLTEDQAAAEASLDDLMEVLSAAMDGLADGLENALKRAKVPLPDGDFQDEFRKTETRAKIEELLQDYLVDLIPAPRD